jgi:hypothetical protein
MPRTPLEPAGSFNHGTAATLSSAVLSAIVGVVPFAATHRVPPSGTPAWAEPDATRVPVSTLRGQLPVQLLEQQPDGWAHILCSNGWSAWVDGRVLVAGATSAARAKWNWNVLFERIVIGPLAFGGAAAAIVGGFLPWLSVGSLSVNAWDLGLLAVLRGSGSSAGAKVGVALLLVAVVALPQVTKKNLPAISVAALGGVANTLSLLVFLQNQRAGVSADVGIGLILTFAGGSAILADFVLGLQRLESGRT